MESEKECLRDEATRRLLPAVSPEGTSQQNMTLYHRRWYILFVFSLAAFSQAAVWNTIGPIAASAKTVFGWSDGNISMLANWTAIAFVATSFLSSWLMDNKGLRTSTVSCVGVLFLAAAIRCTTSDNRYVLWTMNGAAILNGFAGTVLCAGPPLLSSTWFPPNQRTTATAIATFMNYIGLAVSFIIGPLLVRQHKDGGGSNSSSLHIANTSNNDTEFIEEQRSDIMRLMYIECGFTGIIFLAVLLYFPAKPPTPPSVSAAVGRVDFKKGLLQLVRAPKFWFISISYALPLGVYSAWGAILDVNLDPLNVTQVEAGWLGFYATIGGCVSGLITASIGDFFPRHLKLMIYILYTVGVLSFAWFAILCAKFIPFNTVSLYISCILTGMCLNGTVPLFYELACETVFPIAEGITMGMMTILFNIFTIIFLFVPLIPHIGTSWINWTLLGSIGASFPLLFFFKEAYSRSKVDTDTQSGLVNQ